MEACESLIDCPSEEEFDECLKKFEIACSPWSMFFLLYQPNMDNSPQRKIC